MLRPWTEEDIAAIRAAWRNRHEMPISIRELSRKYQRSREVVRMVVMHKDYTPSRTVDRKRALAIREDFKRGLSLTAIQLKYRVSRRHIHKLTEGISDRVAAIDLISYGRNCPTNQRIKELMEAPR